MGKSKRLRARRLSRDRSAGPVAAEVLTNYPFEVDEQTCGTLGAQGLRLLAENLWPVDCQTCGWELGSARPSVLVTELAPFMVSASVHHARCQPAAWITDVYLTMNGQARLSYANQTFLCTLRDSNGQPHDRPLVLANPSLEMVTLRQRQKGQWTADTVDFFRSMGLRTPGEDLVIDRPLPDFSAELDGTTLTIRVHDTGEQWEATVTSQVESRLRELGGTLLGVTTAVHPHRITHHDQMVPLLGSGQVAMGWIALTGVEQPLTDTPPPENLKTYVLHYSTDHATVGELLATTDPSLSPAQARAWAGDHISLPGDPDLPRVGRHLDWQQVNRDPNAWYLLGALSLGELFVRRHDDAWTLVKVVSRIDGAFAADTDDKVQDWATRAARIRGDVRILSWVPAPTTASGFTTFHGAAIPR